MKNPSDTYTLHNDVRIPCIGFGTWQASNGDEAVKAVKQALTAGYRHIDTAAVYGNEESVGTAVRESGLPRSEVFVTSKLQNAAHGYEETKAAFEATMARLQLDYLDLYLIHWPNPKPFRDRWQEANAGTWRAFEEFYEAGRIRSIGVSNFHPHHLEALAKTANTPPMVNQIRLCPGDTQDTVVDYCRQHNILLEAYSPFGTGSLFEVKEMQDIASQYDKTVAQVAIRWSLQMGFLPLPKSVTESRIRENIEVFDFTLSDKDMERIASLDGIVGYSQDPDQTHF